MLYAVLMLAQAAANPAAPAVGDGPAPSLNLPQVDLPEHPRAVATRPLPEASTPAENHLANCLAQANSEPDDALDTASEWLKATSGAGATGPQICLGTAFAGLERWREAQDAFIAARDAALPADHLTRARTGIMAGNAALGGGAPVEALAVLDVAHGDASAAVANNLLGGIAIDRARALVLLKRPEAAADALAEARKAAPEDATAWLLSATISRRLGRLAEAQTEIETAARLAPTDPDVGLEAGVIAVLAGHAEAARKSWQSVVTADLDGPAGKQAAAYLRQIGPGTMPGPAAPLPTGAQ